MSYKRGRTFEYRVRDVFRKYGYACDRKAASSPYDLMVREEGRTVFLGECKKTGVKDFIYIQKEDMDKLVREAKKQRAVPLLLYGFYRSPVFVARPEEVDFTGKMYKVIKGDNLALDEFLKEFKLGKRKNAKKE